MKLLPGEDLVLIKADDVDREKEGSKIIMSDQEKQNANKLQNRGKIIAVGDNVKFWEEGDYVSFYRNAATPIQEAGVEYLTIHRGHILVKFIEE